MGHVTDSGKTRSTSSALTKLFQHQVLEMLVRENRLSQEFSQKLRNWHYSGFQVWAGRSVTSDDLPALERLCAYILRPSFAGTRLDYYHDNEQIEYETTKGVHQSMDALDWIARVTSHIPNPNEQTVRYYGRFSNAARGKRHKQALGQPVADEANSVSEPDSITRHFARDRSRNWARLLKKIYEIEPLTCPQCGGQMDVIAFIEESAFIRKTLQHLGLWDRPTRSPPHRLFPHKMETLLQSLTPRKAQQVRASSDSLFWDGVPVIEE